MPLPPIECANCGAQYRLPESFKADQAKCKKCGAVIDVAGQREPAAEASAGKAAAAKPAAAKPAAAAAGARQRTARTERSERPKRPAGRDKRTERMPRAVARDRAAAVEGEAEDTPAAGRRSGRAGRSSARGARAEGARAEVAPARGGRSRGAASRRRGGDDEDAPEGRGRGSRAKAKSNTPLVVGGVIGVLAILVVVLLMVLGGDNKPGETDATAKAAAEKAAEEKAAEEAAAKAQEEEKARQTAAEKAAAEAEANQQEVDPKPAVAKKPARKKNEITSRDEVYKPKVELQEMAWPEYVSEDEREEIKMLLQDIRDGGLAGIRANRTLEEKGHKALVGIINLLRDLNYLDTEDTMLAYSLNRLLGSITAGFNAGFRSFDIGAEIPLGDAHWNGKTVKAWQGFWRANEDPDEFEKMVKQRQKAQSKK